MNSRSFRQYATGMLVCLLTLGGIASIWGGVALFLRGPCGWMALLAALDAAFLLRLSGFPAGTRRAIWALLATLLAIPAGAFVAAAIRIGVAFGALPHDAIWRIGPDFALTWWQLNASAWDIVALLLALPLAWLAAR